MAWQDRPYYREDTRSESWGSGFGARFGGASVVIWLLGINAAAFLLNAVLVGSQRGQWLAPGPTFGFDSSGWGVFRLDRAVWGLQLWRWVTYQFLHHDFFHLLFNMFGLYFFGPIMERWWGSRRFLAFYLLCGIGAAGLYSLFALVPRVLGVDASTSLVGASGSIFGILVGCAILYARQRVMLIFPPVPMTMRTLALLFLGIALVSLMAGSANAGGEAAHLGGAAVGWLLVRRPGLLNFTGWFSRGRLGQKLQRTRRQRQRRREDAERAEVDRILDKVRDEGLGSLTHREKKTLQRATERRRRVG